MELGALIPLGDIGGDPAVVRDYAQAVEAMGYDFLEAPDHVLGVNAGRRGPTGTEPQHVQRPVPRPVRAVRLSSPAARSKLGFSTGVLILPQRQTVLVAKQAACLDVLCGGRFRLGIGVGWNEVEFVGLNENFHNRGRRSEEQVQVMQALWAEPHVTLQGPLAHDRGCRHQPAAGVRPRAGVVRRPSRAHAAAHRQMGRRLDAERLSAGPDARSTSSTKLRAPDREAEGRDPAAVGIEVWTSCGAGTRGRLAQGGRVLEVGRRLASSA